MSNFKLIIEYPGEKLCYPYNHVRIEDTNATKFFTTRIEEWLAMGTDAGHITPLDENNQPISDVPVLHYLYARSKKPLPWDKPVKNKKAAAK